MADDLGKRLLAEIEEIGLDEILYRVQLRSHDASEPIPYFGLAALDAILNATQRPTARAEPIPPVIELTSTSPGGGSTHMLYHLCALATLPRTYGGKQAGVILVDADNTFSISRLAQQIAYHIKQGSSPEDRNADIERTVLDSLTHIHVLRPQSLASTIASIRALPTYLFTPRKHQSIDRSIAFLALDSATAFSWQARATAIATAAEVEASASSDTHETYATLTQTLQDISKQLTCPLVLTAHLLHPLPPAAGYQTQNIIRPTLPAPMSTLPTLRLIVRRVPVRKFPAGISASEARREAADRQRAVDAGKFECVVNEWGMDGERMRGLRGGRSGFEFRITGDGVVMEGEEETNQQRQDEEPGEVG